MTLRTISWILLASAAVCGTAHAGEQGVVPTAPVTADAPPSAPPAANADDTSGRISAWIHTADDGSVQSGDSAQPLAASQAPLQPRSVHGEVGVAAGGRGFNSEYGVADIPVGRTGDVVVAASNTQGRLRGGGSVQGRSLSLGIFLDGASAPSQPCASPYGYGGYGAPVPGAYGDEALGYRGPGPNCGGAAPPE